MNAERITSRRNPLLQHIRQLLRDGSYRRDCGEYAGDGLKLLSEAVRWGAALKTILVSDGLELDAPPENVRLVRVPEDVMASLSLMKTPQGVIFTCALPRDAPLSFSGGALVLDGIQDPGNLGTILRTADALDVPVVLCGDCADPYSPKTVRASMGAVFRSQPQRASCGELAAYCDEKQIVLTAAALHREARDLRSLDLSRAAVAVGSEGRGVGPELFRLAKQRLVIPMSARCESLNAAAAAAIILWEMKR